MGEGHAKSLDLTFKYFNGDFFVFYQDLVVFLPIGEAVKSQEKCLALEKGNQTWNGWIVRENPISPLLSIAFRFPGEGSHRHFSLAAWMPGASRRDRKSSSVRVISWDGVQGVGAGCPERMWVPQPCKC